MTREAFIAQTAAWFMSGPYGALRYEGVTVPRVDEAVDAALALVGELEKRGLARWTEHDPWTEGR